MDDAKVGPYAVLQVPPDASPADIRRAYLALALQLHPDKCRGGQQQQPGRFQLVQDAYRVLSDPVRRAEYDALAASSARQRSPPPAAAAPAEACDPEPSVHVVHVAARDVRLGRPDLPLDLTLDAECAACSGRRTCKECAGAGHAIHGLGAGLAIRLTCIVCAGTGQAFGGRLGCRACGDTGVTRARRTIVIPVPRGVRDDHVLRLRGQGAFDPHTRTHRDMCLHFRRTFPVGTRVLDEEGGDVEVRVRVSLGECLTGTDRLAVDVLGHPVVLRASGYFDPTHPVVLSGRGLPRRQRPEERGGDAGRRLEHGSAILRFDVTWPGTGTEGDRRVTKNLHVFRAALRKMMRVGAGSRDVSGDVSGDEAEAVDICAISASATS